MLAAACWAFARSLDATVALDRPLLFAFVAAIATTIPSAPSSAAAAFVTLSPVPSFVVGICIGSLRLLIFWPHPHSLLIPLHDPSWPSAVIAETTPTSPSRLIRPAPDHDHLDLLPDCGQALPTSPASAPSALIRSTSVSPPDTVSDRAWISSLNSGAPAPQPNDGHLRVYRHKTYARSPRTGVGRTVCASLRVPPGTNSAPRSSVAAWPSFSSITIAPLSCDSLSLCLLRPAHPPRISKGRTTTSAQVPLAARARRA
ncbi:uncharacterized protein PSFLO_02974 [Pseudozyma flocculosa]|uniref:Uncharacterized protein n=1 Tax=Pseudozyma flocculosa TaxID=84751 RepID=A0A5C3F1Y6_9BASI|nr:uncharacterized protein PSFLO_02974 [Pseudozyma flocculosa]